MGGPDAQAAACFDLGIDIDMGSRVVAYDDDGEVGLDAFCFQGRYALKQFSLNLRGTGPSVQSLCRHMGSKLAVALSVRLCG